MSFLSMLQNDLRTLSLEARKKFPQIKETTERAILKLRNVDEQEHDLAKKIEAVAKADEVLKPLLLACDSNNPKMIAIGVGSIQKLIAQNAASLPRIMRVLAQQVEAGDDTVKLKILQAVVSLLTTQTNMHGESLSQSLCMCFRLHKNKSVAIKNTASATLRQIVTMLFDRALLEFQQLDGETLDAMAQSPSEKSAVGDSNQRMPKNLPPSIKDAHFLLQDLCSLTGGDNPIWLPVQAISKTFGFELIEALLSTHQPLFIHIYEFQLLLKDRICPLVVKALGAKAGLFTYSVRLLRLVGTFIRNFINLMRSECEVFLERMVRIMSQETPIWTKALTLEVLKDICSNEKLLRSMYVNYDAKALQAVEAADSQLVFEGMVKAIARFVQKIFDLNNKLVMHAEPARTKCIDMMSHREPPATISLSYTLNLAIIDAVASLAIQKVKVLPSPVLQYEPIRRVLQFDNPFEEGGVTKVEVVAPTAKTNVQTPRSHINEDEDEEEEEEEGPGSADQQSEDEDNTAAQKDTKKMSGMEISRRMAESSWTSILPALALMLTKAGDESIVEGILRAYQLFIHICGSNELIAPRDAFLTSLCHFAIPSSSVTITAETGGDDKDGTEPTPTKTVTTKIQVFDGVLMGKNVLALRTLISLAHGMGGILGSAWPLVLQTLETLHSILHPTSAKSLLAPSDAPNPTLEKKGSATALPGIGGSGNGGLGASSSGVKTSDDSSRGIERLPSPREISYLSTSLESVFEGSKYLDDQSLEHFIAALVSATLASLSSNALLAYEVKRPATTPSDAATPVNHPAPLFGLSKLVDTALQNIIRIDTTWPIISAHLILVSNHKVPSVRSYGVESLAKIMETSLTRLPAIPRRSFSVPSFSSKAQISQILYDMSSVAPTVGTPLDQSPAPSLPIRSPAPAPTPQPSTPGMTSPSSLRRRTVDKQAPPVPDMQIPFLELLDALAQSKHTDTRSKTMQALFAILQSSGQSLSTGWPVVLAIINKGNNDKQLIQVAFRCLGFICSDFLTNLPIECVEKVIVAIGKFGRQTAFMNISLTAVGLLWNISDFLATEIKALRKQLAEAVEKEAELILGSWLMDSTTSNKLWLSTYHELKQLCVDARTEVRNCAIQTLFKTLSTHGSLLEHDIWPSVIAQILFPLMNEIRNLSASAGKNRIDTELGKEGGKSVIMMVHHTRNTEEKQWNETQVLALQGIVQVMPGNTFSRVFRTYFPTLSALPDFAQTWSALLGLFLSAATSHSAEVSACAIQSLRELMHPHVADDRFERLLWEDMWTTLQQIGDYLTRHHPRDLPFSDIPHQSLLELVRTVGHVHSKFRGACTTGDIRRLLGIVGPLALYPGEEERRISPLQKKVLKVIEKLLPVAEEIYPVVFKQLTDYVTTAINYAPAPSPASPLPSSSSVPQKAAAVLPGRRFHPLAMKAMDLSVRCLETAPPAVVSQVFEELITVLGAGMMLKYVSYASPLWRTAVRAFTRAVTHALPIVARTPDLGEEQERRVWTQLYACLQDFLFHAAPRQLPPAGRTADEAAEDEALDVGLADMLALHMLRCAAGGRIGVPCGAGRPAGDLRRGLLRQSLPPDDERRLAAGRPLPRHQLAEVTALLRQLRDLQLQPGLPLPETEAEETSMESGRVWRSREHLLRLYPQLCDCITTREDQVKPLLRELFHIAGAQVGLQ
ncbi:MON2 family protein [Acanthamoeba castellanii str. Neff]|uniref:Protein MON2 homolog n=1 Tax=Acanthamoeba castellanii (strain ATCC 30010 / Neff) TaxID=1257118 RepID=L8H3Z7_ACACF|nr:MON2 family protein [Acanthamoeba castellanii str. Neff]ELR19146.1 MON2 family protein [Acanthamoeba castellanii str. Neff]